MMKQVLLALITIIAVASLGAVGTYAHFSDTETSAGNYLETGSLDLQLADTLPFPGGPWPLEPDEGYGEDPIGDSVTLTWDYELGYPNGMLPGDYLTSRVKLRNVGTIAGSSLHISCVNENSAPPGGPLDKDTQMIIEELIYYNGPPVDLLALLKTELGKDTITLDDWESHPITGLTPPPLGGQACLDMTVRFDLAAPDSYQGCEVMMTLIFTLK